MTSPTPGPSDSLLQDPPDFSLVLGGPLFQLLRRAHLSDDALTLVRQRIVVISLFAWLPLLVLAAFAIAYADQSERDHAVLMKAVRAGRLEVRIERE